jgi:hypothetical protein
LILPYFKGWQKRKFTLCNISGEMIYTTNWPKMNINRRFCIRLSSLSD